MRDQDHHDAPDKHIDSLLREAFPAVPGLSDDFDKRVLSHARRAHGRVRFRARSLIMAVYWAAASLVSVWLLAATGGGFETTDLPEGMGTVLAAMAVPALGVLAITKLAGIRLSELFAGTLGEGDEVMD